MKLTPRQQATLKTILDDFVEETKGSPTKAQEAKVFISVMANLTIDQQAQLNGLAGLYAIRRIGHQLGAHARRGDHMFAIGQGAASCAGRRIHGGPIAAAADIELDLCIGACPQSAACEQNCRKKQRPQRQALAVVCHVKPQIAP